MWKKLKYLHVIVMLLSLSLNSYALDSNNMHFHGELVEQPCTIAPGKEAIELDFTTVVNKYLYRYHRTISKKFTIELSKCDLTLGTSVQLLFKGVEHPELTGLLALDATSKASGIAIGIETMGEEPVPLNKIGKSRYELVSGVSYIHLKAYVQAEPKAITNKTIKEGPFSASTTFVLNYD